ncbi:hypothetical protein, partial [Aquibium carbonis]|uniref:hypothetical protein n=1 Tax=Aquibium carbonis TaxID=2495581 RepID=UPI001AED0CC1
LTVGSDEPGGKDTVTRRAGVCSGTFPAIPQRLVNHPAHPAVAAPLFAAQDVRHSIRDGERPCT